MGKLEGKIALITGGNSGIGLATARRFVAEGARVAITGRDEATLAATANELGVTAIKSDVLDMQARSSLFDRIKNEFGHLDHRYWRIFRLRSQQGGRAGDVPLARR
jgi:NAD(P)-dependent dehydrogenase (short-subunit alcohol dehydrogenase family)